MRDWYASAGGSTFAFRAVYMPWLALAWAIAVVSMIVFVIGIVRWRRQRFLAAITLFLDHQDGDVVAYGWEGVPTRIDFRTQVALGRPLR
jgi:hypothetical protein